MTKLFKFIYFHRWLIIKARLYVYFHTNSYYQTHDQKSVIAWNRNRYQAKPKGSNVLTYILGNELSKEKSKISVPQKACKLHSIMVKSSYNFSIWSKIKLWRTVCLQLLDKECLVLHNKVLNGNSDGNLKKIVKFVCPLRKNCVIKKTLVSQNTLKYLISEKTWDTSRMEKIKQAGFKKRAGWNFSCKMIKEQDEK